MTTTPAEPAIHPALRGTSWVPTVDTFGARLALLRHHMGWNAAEAARECGIPVATWRDWETRGQLPRNIRQAALQINAATGAHLVWLQGFDVHERRPRTHFKANRIDTQEKALRARRDSNSQPSDPKVDASAAAAYPATRGRRVPQLPGFTPQNGREARGSISPAALGGAA
jgi:transcriptional regulator with XRE-family HTH domain